MPEVRRKYAADPRNAMMAIRIDDTSVAHGRSRLSR
jgi:hypothetical protein